MRLARPIVAITSALAVVGCSLLTSLDELGGSRDAAVDASSEPLSDGGAEASCAADLSSDPANCGACGHDCCGGACDKGVCQPRVLATQQNNVTYVRADSKYAFWTVGANVALQPTDVMRVQLDGSGLGKFVNGRGVVHGYSEDSQRLYWLEFIPYVFHIVSAAKDAVLTDAGAPFTSNPAADPKAGTQIASFMFVDPTYAFWIAGAPTECPSGLCVYRAPTAAIAAGDAGYQILSPVGGIKGGFAQDLEFFYVWVTGNTIVRIRKSAAPDGGSTTEVVVPGLPDISGIAADSKRVYWSDTAAATIYAASKVPSPDAGAPQVFATLQNVPTGLEADDSDVYWANTDGIVTCPTTGCPNGPDKPRVLVKESGITSFSLTPKCFVWANGGTATVNVVGR